MVPPPTGLPPSPGTRTRKALRCRRRAIGPTPSSTAGPGTRPRRGPGPAGRSRPGTRRRGFAGQGSNGFFPAGGRLPLAPVSDGRRALAADATRRPSRHHTERAPRIRLSRRARASDSGGERAHPAPVHRNTLSDCGLPLSMPARTAARTTPRLVLRSGRSITAIVADRPGGPLSDPVCPTTEAARLFHPSPSFSRADVAG
jgi:hypothetical protein